MGSQTEEDGKELITKNLQQTRAKNKPGKTNRKLK